MSGKTPGQAAYEAFDAIVYEKPDPSAWDRTGDLHRQAWEAAAQAAIAAADVERGDLAAQLDYANRHCEDLRALIAEILGAFFPMNSALAFSTSRADVSADRMVQWRQRAGLDTAIATAGTEWLAAELAERKAGA